jgi:hypothetical protein
MYIKFWLENLNNNDYLEYSGMDVRIILRWPLQTYFEKVQTGLIRGISGFCENNNNPRGSIRVKNVFE